MKGFIVSDSSKDFIASHYYESNLYLKASITAKWKCKFYSNRSDFKLLLRCKVLQIY